MPGVVCRGQIAKYDLHAATPRKTKDHATFGLTPDSGQRTSGTVGV